MEAIKNFMKNYPITSSVILAFFIYMIYVALKGKKGAQKLITGESSFTPTPGSPRGVFAPVPPPPAPGPPAVPPAPPGPPAPPSPPTPGAGHREDHPRPPYPYPYPYGPYNYPYQYSTVYLLDSGDTDVNRDNPCYQKIADSRGDLTICVTRREYIIYLKGRLEYWREKFKTAITHGEFSTVTDTYKKIANIKSILKAEGV